MPSDHCLPQTLRQSGLLACRANQWKKSRPWPRQYLWVYNTLPALERTVKRRRNPRRIQPPRHVSRDEFSASAY